MTLTASDAARYAVRPLLPGPLDGVRSAVERIGAPLEALPHLARLAASEALVVHGLAPDQARVLERELQRLGGLAICSADASQAVLLGSLQAIAALPEQLIQWGRGTESIGWALQRALHGKGSPPPPVRAGRFTLDFTTRTLVMGIVNATPDSFSGDSVGDDTGAAVALAHAQVEAGADLIDVGGESTRPGSTAVDAGEELRRVLPVIRALAADVPVPVSIDTRKATVARAALDAGASMVNDIWGLRGDPAMAEVVAQSDAALVAMHNQVGTDYGEDLLAAIARALYESLRIAEEHGIGGGRILLDPGFGFGKTPAQNLEVVRRLGELRGLGRPLLLGVSRKSTLGLLAGGAPPDQRLEGTIALSVLGVANGAHVVRVHDVAACVHALRAADAVLRGTPRELLTLAAPGRTG